MARDPLSQTVQTTNHSKPAGRRFLSFLASALFQLGILAGLTLVSIVAVRALPEPHGNAGILTTPWIPVVPPSGHVTRPDTPVDGSPTSRGQVHLDKAFIVPTMISTEIVDHGLLDFDARSAESVVGIPGFEGGIPGGLPPPPPLPSRKPRDIEPVRIGGEIRAPQKTSHVDPIYPAIAIKGRVEGFVILETIIDATGRVRGLRVLRSVPLLDKAAIEAVRQWKYEPTLLNGQPVPIVMTVTVRFVLDR